MIRTWVRQSSWSCCSNPAAPRSCQRCCAGRRTRTIYLQLKPPLLLPPPRWPPSPGTSARPPETENVSHHGRPLPGNFPPWSCGRGSPERSPGIPHDHLCREQAHRGKRRAGGRSSRLQVPDSFLTSAQAKHVKGLQPICNQPSFRRFPPISDDNYQSVKTFCLRIHLHSSDLSHYDPLFRNIINKEVIIILLGLKGFIVQPERDYLNIECCSYHHSLPLCTHLFWMLGFLQSQKLATVSGWIHTVTTNLTWTNVHAHDKHDV